LSAPDCLVNLNEKYGIWLAAVDYGSCGELLISLPDGVIAELANCVDQPPAPPRPRLSCDPGANPPEMCPPIGKLPARPCPNCGSSTCYCPAPPPPPPPPPRPLIPAEERLCGVALRDLCDVDRLRSSNDCGFCAGLHLEELVGAKCDQAYIQAFCTGQTCTAQLEDLCGETKQDCEACLKCTRAATAGGNDDSDSGSWAESEDGSLQPPSGSNATAAACKDDMVEMDAFCGEACAPSFSCMMQLEKRCGHERKQGSFQCAMCTGRAVAGGPHGPGLQGREPEPLEPEPEPEPYGALSSCGTSEEFTATEREFCASSSSATKLLPCVPALANSCPASTSCYACAACALGLNSSRSTCRDVDMEIYCKENSRSPAPGPMVRNEHVPCFSLAGLALSGGAVIEPLLTRGMLGRAASQR